MMNGITSYADDMAHWEDWHREYRFGVLLLFPPEPLRSRVNRLRSQHDPVSQQYCDAHISLTVPAAGPVTEAQWAALEGIASEISPFEVRYGPLKNYPPHPGVCLAIEPFEQFDALRIALEAVAPFSEAPARRYPFSPHMTLAEFITAERTASLMEALAPVAPQGSYLCTHVAYAVPDNAFHFTERRRLQLGTTSLYA